MRLFTAIQIAPNVVDNLVAALAGGIRVPVENLHITLKFIGAWPEERLPELMAALGAVAIAAPIPITVSGLGLFPDARHPRFFYAGVQGGTGLAALAAAIDRALAPLGVASEKREYRPHITLAKFRDPGGLPALPELDFGSFSARSFHLYSSRPGAAASVYTTLATYDLMRGNSVECTA